jgi:hypothetical protein
MLTIKHEKLSSYCCHDPSGFHKEEVMGIRWLGFEAMNILPGLVSAGGKSFVFGSFFERCAFWEK